MNGWTKDEQGKLTVRRPDAGQRSVYLGFDLAERARELAGKRGIKSLSGLIGYLLSRYVEWEERQTR